MVEDPAEDPAEDPSGELAVDVAMVPDGAAEEGAEVPDGAPEGVEAEPEGVTAWASVALVCLLSPAPALTAVKEEV